MCPYSSELEYEHLLYYDDSCGYVITISTTLNYLI